MDKEQKRNKYLEEEDIKLLYSTLSFHYMFSPKEHNFEQLKRYIELLQFFKPKYIGFKLTDKKYKGDDHKINMRRSPEPIISVPKWMILNFIF